MACPPDQNHSLPSPLLYSGCSALRKPRLRIRGLSLNRLRRAPAQGKKAVLPFKTPIFGEEESTAPTVHGESLTPHLEAHRISPAAHWEPNGQPWTTWLQLSS
ncbi:hypothetical protein EYF80_009542 [Liparis tanakae]|uniref:Uncharacterized protein n=1 Tax=Liparis tanakae TaxID=230148 RepID=A0A4Z2IR12_9TELE|nr:hypothetical protein EYF80_009542 [Liparis tanakae]